MDPTTATATAAAAAAAGGGGVNAHCPGFAANRGVVAKLVYTVPGTPEFEAAPAYRGVVKAVVREVGDIDRADVKRLMRVYTRHSFSLADMRYLVGALLEHRGK